MGQGLAEARAGLGRRGYPTAPLTPPRPTPPQDVAARCIDLVAHTPSITTLDITGGAPELNAQFRPLIHAVSSLNAATGRSVEVIDRCNLTVLAEVRPPFASFPRALTHLSPSRHNSPLPTQYPEPTSSDRPWRL